MRPASCECVGIAGSLRLCPAHGMFATASRRVELEAEVEQAVAERDALLGALDGIVRAAIEHGVNDQVSEALAYADKIVARRIRQRSITGGMET